MKNGRWIVLSFILGWLAAACGVQGESPSTISDSTHAIDPEFAPLVQRLGEYAGEAICDPFSDEGIRYQYTTNVLLVHDPAAPLQTQYRLDPLADYWSIAEPPVADPQDSAQIYVNGHIVWEEAQALYIKLGADLMGKPLTEVRYNPNHHRYEQYFEKMGVYRRENDPYGTIAILPYGTWTCAEQCEPETPDYSSPARFPEAPQDEQLRQGEAAFAERVRQMGMQFTGQPLSPAYFAADGKIEKVYENLILFWDPGNAGTVELRNLPLAVGIHPSPLVPAISGMHFYQVNGELGYNLSQDFMVYISRHGTLARFGPPITEMHAGPNDITRQCFEKVCLLYDQSAPKALVIRPEALGYQYLSSVYVPQNGYLLQEPVSPSEISPLSQLHLTIWQEADIVPQGEFQTIGAGVYDGQQPMIGAEMVVTLTLPDGSQRSYPMPPTGENGQSQVVVEPIAAEKGTLIPYQVCIVNLPESQFCASHEYIIWDD